MLVVMMVLEDSDGIGISTYQCLCLPNDKLITKNITKRHLHCRLIEFLVFNLFTRKSVSTNVEKHVDFIPTFFYT